MVTLALAVIAAAWLVQLLQAWGGDKKIHVYFILAYALGVALIIVDGFPSGLTSDLWLQIATFVFALLVFLRVRK
jgi:ABC-type branched-subunit amino acid transport system permease subunit